MHDNTLIEFLYTEPVIEKVNDLDILMADISSKLLVEVK